MPGSGATGPTADRGPAAWRRGRACSGVTSRLILSYIERREGPAAVQELLRKAGLEGSGPQLRDENSWFSFDQKIALWEAAEAVTGDRRIAERVGESALEFSVALGLKRALRALGSPDFVYRNVARANSKFNWAHTLEVIERDHDHARLRYEDVAGVGYHHYDCDYSIGLLRTVPQLFGLPAARVAHPLCGARGDDQCEFDVQWVGGMESIKRSTLLAGAAAGVLIGAGALFDRRLAVAGLGLGAGAACAAGARVVVFMRRRIDALEYVVRDQHLAAEGQLTSLAALSRELKLDEVLDRITASASSAIGGAQFALLIAGVGGMRADRYAGVSPESLRRLESWADDSRRMLGRGSIAIDDVGRVASLSGLADEHGLPLGSACAAPLVFGDRLLGVLVALAHGAKVFLPQDIQALETYAAHAAIALSNARLVEQLEREAATDPLTGLANKRAFELAYGAELSRAARKGNNVALVLIDIDHFKDVNDTFGHPFGDRVLVAVSKALRSAVRTHDTVARLGGEEFAMLVPDADLEDAREIAERARALIADVELPGAALSSSAGAAATSAGPERSGELFDAA
ncbi:MAG TPA: sensor domain-containing diguanylate cyclase, partial [Solirubrobacteraceae bacterium]